MEEPQELAAQGSNGAGSDRTGKAIDASPTPREQQHDVVDTANLVIADPEVRRVVAIQPGEQRREEGIRRAGREVGGGSGVERTGRAQRILDAVPGERVRPVRRGSGGEDPSGAIERPRLPDGRSGGAKGPLDLLPGARLQWRPLDRSVVTVIAAAGSRAGAARRWRLGHGRGARSCGARGGREQGERADVEAH
ncbi:MAG: hypothetical protein WCC48_14970 [Anaeromyxobacteraceae bacterium]